jgi:hypothetical protein
LISSACFARQALMGSVSSSVEVMMFEKVGGGRIDWAERGLGAATGYGDAPYGVGARALKTGLAGCEHC